MKSGDVIAEVETDKATMDLEAFDSGIIRKILVKEGEKVAVQSRIGIIGTKDEKIDELARPHLPPRPRRRKRPPRRRHRPRLNPRLLLRRPHRLPLRRQAVNA